MLRVYFQEKGFLTFSWVVEIKHWVKMGNQFFLLFFFYRRAKFFKKYRYSEDLPRQGYDTSFQEVFHQINAL